MNEVIDKTKFIQLKKLVERIEKEPHLQDRLEETEISLEFLLGNLFPSVYNNMKDALNEEHTKGYIEGFNKVEYPIHVHQCPDCNYRWFTDYLENKYCPHCGKNIE